ncbi:MAG: divergent polysaccharide deacetylase family protein [Rhizobiaceae bacterium]|nr:divergent polysaccharide deacetylase family protein [Rhizobiaceae bacterium]
MEPGSELDKPLGQNRRRTGPGAGSSPSGRSKWHPRLLAITSLVIIVAAGLLAFQPSGLRNQSAALTSQTVSAPQVAVSEPSAAAGVSNETIPDTVAEMRQPANSGANFQRTLTGDGQVVTTISPRDRDNDGPLVLSGGDTIGQEARIAHLPVPELLENSEFGRLPVRSADGKRPVDAYARPWSGSRGARLAIVVGGLGLSQTGTQYALQTLPEEITLAFAASGNSLQRWLQEARRNGHEVLLQVPFEPFDFPTNNPGPHTLVVADGEKQNLADLHWAMARITNYTGIMNFMGGRFLSDPAATEPIMRDLAKRGVLFLDDGTSAQTVTGAIASAVGVPHVSADLVVDASVKRGEILKKLDEAERIARLEGTAIATASAFETSVDAIASWANEAKARGIEIVGVSALADRRENN